MMLIRPLHRLGALGTAVLVVAAAWPAVATEDGPLVLTPPQAEGPFYPVEIPADSDPDLTVVEGSPVRATGDILELEGSLMRVDGTPIEGALIEIWQTDANGVYLHPGDPGIADRDVAFQGFGVSETDADGAWAFRTILPEVYGSRPRHIHAKVKVDDATVLTTQIYFSGGDIPDEGSLEATGTELDALLVEVSAALSDDGEEVLTAEHMLVLP